MRVCAEISYNFRRNFFAYAKIEFTNSIISPQSCKVSALLTAWRLGSCPAGPPPDTILAVPCLSAKAKFLSGDKYFFDPVGNLNKGRILIT
jgi:hypothetical protein